MPPLPPFILRSPRLMGHVTIYHLVIRYSPPLALKHGSGKLYLTLWLMATATIDLTLQNQHENIHRNI